MAQEPASVCTRPTSVRAAELGLELELAQAAELTLEFEIAQVAELTLGLVLPSLWHHERNYSRN